MRRHFQPIRSLLAYIHSHKLDLAVLQQILSAFVDQELRVFQQIPLVRDEPIRACTLGLFIRYGQKDHVAV